MRLIYDPQADVLQVRLRGARIHSSEELEPGVSVQYDADGHVIGIEMADARRRLTLEELTGVSYENLALQRRASLTLP